MTTLFGFKAIDRLALFAVPLLICFLIYVSKLAMTDVSWPAVLNIRGANPDYFYTAVSTVVGSLIVGVVLMPDLSRYARTTGELCFRLAAGQWSGQFLFHAHGSAPRHDHRPG